MFQVKWGWDDGRFVVQRRWQLPVILLFFLHFCCFVECFCYLPLYIIYFFILHLQSKSISCQISSIMSHCDSFHFFPHLYRKCHFYIFFFCNILNVHWNHVWVDYKKSIQTLGYLNELMAHGARWCQRDECARKSCDRWLWSRLQQSFRCECDWHILLQTKCMWCIL